MGKPPETKPVEDEVAKAVISALVKHGNQPVRFEPSRAQPLLRLAVPRGTPVPQVLHQLVRFAYFLEKRGDATAAQGLLQFAEELVRTPPKSGPR